MKKILTYIFICLTIFSFAQNPVTNTIPLPKGGSITIPQSTFDNTLYYRLTTDSNKYQIDTLATDLSFIYSDGRTPSPGTIFYLWFNNTDILPNGHHVFVLSNDFTHLLSTTVNLQLACQYNGYRWTVFSNDSLVNQKLSSYVSLPQLVDTLQNYPQQLQLTNALDTLAGVNSGNFQKILVPLTSTADSSLNAWNSAEGKRVLQSYALKASPVLTGAPLSTTPANGDNSTKIATTNYVQNTLAIYRDSLISCAIPVNSSVTLGTGAGTGASATVSGYDCGFQINLTTGSAPATSATICTVAFGGTYSITPVSIIQGRNVNATSAASYLVTPSESTTGISLVSGGTALAGATQYIFNVIVNP